MAQFISIDEKTSVSGQLQTADLREAAALGFKLVVSNRPDGEGPGQPSSAALAAEAAKQGMTFVNVPFTTPQSVSPAQIAEFAQLLRETDGKVLAFCRSGLRSSMLWATANVALGAPIADVLAKAAKAGYDLRQATGLVEQLGQAAAALK